MGRLERWENDFNRKLYDKHLSVEQTEWLFSEVHRLRAVIKEYLDNEYGLGWDKRDDLYTEDKKLRDALEEKMNYPKLKDALASSKTNKYQEDIFKWCKHFDIPVPIFEFKFDRDRKFRADLAYPTRNLLIEINGGTFIRGRHNRPLGLINDMEKRTLAALRGYYTMEFTPQDIHNGSAFRIIKEFLDGKEVKP